MLDEWNPWSREEEVKGRKKRKRHENVLWVYEIWCLIFDFDCECDVRFVSNWKRSILNKRFIRRVISRNKHTHTHMHTHTYDIWIRFCVDKKFEWNKNAHYFHLKMNMAMAFVVVAVVPSLCTKQWKNASRKLCIYNFTYLRWKIFDYFKISDFHWFDSILRVLILLVLSLHRWLFSPPISAICHIVLTLIHIYLWIR